MNNSEFDKYENSEESKKLNKSFNNFKIMSDNRRLDFNDVLNDLLHEESFNQKLKNNLIKFDYILNYYLIQVERQLYNCLSDLDKLKTD